MHSHKLYYVEMKNECQMLNHHSLYFQRNSLHKSLARNMLLTFRETAKISDFGNGCILDIDPQSHQTMTSLPGTLEYMPPEALSASAEYDVSLDVFSFGHLALFVAIQESPNPILPYADGPHLRKELERRQKYLSKAEQLDSIIPRKYTQYV